MEIIQKEVFCRIGRDSMSHDLFIVGLGINEMDEKIANLVCQKLNMSPKELHEKTCNIKKIYTPSIAGDNDLAEKVVRLKFAIAISVEDCEIIDDISKEEAEQRKKEEIKNHLENFTFIDKKEEK